MVPSNKIFFKPILLQVFDAYAQFEESMISAKMEDMKHSAEPPSQDEETDLELRLARFEILMDRRPLLLNR